MLLLELYSRMLLITVSLLVKCPYLSVCSLTFIEIRFSLAHFWRLQRLFYGTISLRANLELCAHITRVVHITFLL